MYNIFKNVTSTLANMALSPYAASFDSNRVASKSKVACPKLMREIKRKLECKADKYLGGNGRNASLAFFYAEAKEIFWEYEHEPGTLFFIY